MENKDYSPQRGMRVKTIKSVLSKKFNEFVGSIKDEKVKSLVKENSIITGGSIASMLMGQEVNDYDIYFTNKETVLAVAQYYGELFNNSNKSLKKVMVVDGASLKGEKYNDLGGVGLNLTPDRVKFIIRSAGVVAEQDDDPTVDDLDEAAPIAEQKDKDEKPKYRPVYITSNAVTLSDQVQIIIRFYGDPSTIHENYDYIHCTNYWTSSNHELVLHTRAMQALMSKELIYVGSKYPIASLIRMRKFIKRGWVINAGQILKIAYQVSKLDLDSIEVLEDQLVGVDVAFFNQLIAKMQETTKAVDGQKPLIIDYGYLSDIIDQLF